MAIFPLLSVPTSYLYFLGGGILIYLGAILWAGYRDDMRRNKSGSRRAIIFVLILFFIIAFVQLVVKNRV